MAPPLPNLDTFQRERGKLVDAFARAETRIVEALAKSGGELKNDTLGAKIKALKGVVSQPKSVAALERISELAEFRSHIVHGTMALTDEDGRRFANFRNAKYAARPIEPSFLISLQNLKLLTTEVSQIAQDLAG